MQVASGLIETHFTLEWCRVCGTPIVMGDGVHEDRKGSGAPFYCINGHVNVFDTNALGTDLDDVQEEVVKDVAESKAAEEKWEPELKRKQRCNICGNFFERLEAHKLRAHDPKYRARVSHSIRQSKARARKAAAKRAVSKGASKGRRAAKR